MNEQILEADVTQLFNPLPLKKHSYPRSVKLLVFAQIMLFLTLIPHFLCVKLPILKEVKTNIGQADSFFDKGHYMLSGMMYDDIYKKYPKYRKAHIRVIQSCFGLIVEDKGFYLSGLSYVEGERFTRAEIKEIERFLPEDYRENFRMIFKFNSFIGK